MTQAKFKKRTTTPAPDLDPWVGCFLPPLVALVLAGIALAVGVGWLALLLSLPAALVVGFWLFGRLLLAAAWIAWRPRAIRGVLVLSDSPVWKSHIEREWIPLIGNSLVLLNWSERERWRASLAVLLWNHFCGFYRWSGFSYGHSNQLAYNPAIILLRGLRRPLVYRFHGAFQAAKHGDSVGLKAMEVEVFQRLGLST